jgi:hypothetical protein
MVVGYLFTITTCAGGSGCIAAKFKICEMRGP